MSLVRPVLAATHSQGKISQPFDGTFYWEPKGYLRRSAVSDRGKRGQFAGSTFCPHIHLAIDYICVEGTHVFAVKSGVISWQGKDSTGAYVVYLRVRRTDAWDVTAIYYHLKANTFRFKIGDSVPRGATVALSGDTGITTGPHLHFELVRTPAKTPVTEIYGKGTRFDPEPFISGTARLRNIT